MKMAPNGCALITQRNEMKLHEIFHPTPLRRTKHQSRHEGAPIVFAISTISLRPVWPVNTCDRESNIPWAYLHNQILSHFWACVRIVSTPISSVVEERYHNEGFAFDKGEVMTFTISLTHQAHIASISPQINLYFHLLFFLFFALFVTPKKILHTPASILQLRKYFSIPPFLKYTTQASSNFK